MKEVMKRFDEQFKVIVTETKKEYISAETSPVELKAFISKEITQAKIEVHEDYKSGSTTEYAKSWITELKAQLGEPNEI